LGGKYEDRREVVEARQMLHYVQQRTLHRYMVANNWAGPHRIFMAWRGTGANGCGVYHRHLSAATATTTGGEKPND
jgi:hypothetical protein